MLKHIVEVNADYKVSCGMPSVLIEYTVTDGTQASHAQMHVDGLHPAFELVKTRNNRMPCVRIVDQKFYMAVCKDLKRQALDHFHGEVITEIRMNER